MSVENYGVTTGIVPIGGWRYEQPFEGSHVLLPAVGEAESASDLVKQITEFRIANMMPIGVPDFDLAVFIKQVSPINDRFPGRSYETPEEAAPKHIPLIERITSWLTAMNYKRPRLLLPHEAEERAAICAACRQNVKWKTGCLPCCDKIEAIGQNIRQLASHPSDTLGACRLHDVHLPTATFIDQDALPSRHPEAPENCWIPAK